MVKLSTMLLLGVLLIGAIIIAYSLFYAGGVAADFAYNAGNTSLPGQYEFAFTGNAAGGLAPYLYTWTFGDGGGASGQAVRHTYTLPGIYTVNLTVSDTAGHTVKVSKSVQNPPTTVPTTAAAQPAPPHVSTPTVSLVAIGVILIGVAVGAYVFLSRPKLLQRYFLLVVVAIVVLTVAAAYYLVTYA